MSPRWRSPGWSYRPRRRSAPGKTSRTTAWGGEIVTGDLCAPEYLPAPGSCDLALSNPPYFPLGSGADGGKARMEASCTLDGLCGAAARVLKNGGRFALVHRSERLCDLMCALRAHALEPKRLAFVRHSPCHPPSAVLLEAVKRGRPGLQVER